MCAFSKESAGTCGPSLVCLPRPAAQALSFTDAFELAATADSDVSIGYIFVVITKVSQIFYKTFCMCFDPILTVKGLQMLRFLVGL